MMSKVCRSTDCWLMGHMSMEIELKEMKWSGCKLKENMSVEKLVSTRSDKMLVHNSEESMKLV